MEKEKLIEKLKYQLLRKLQYQLNSKDDVVYITKEEADLILTSLTAPVPDGKVTDEEIELAGLELQRRIKDRITTFNWTFKEGAKWMRNKLKL